MTGHPECPTVQTLAETWSAVTVTEPSDRAATEVLATSCASIDHQVGSCPSEAGSCSGTMEATHEPACKAELPGVTGYGTRPPGECPAGRPQTNEFDPFKEN